MGEIQHINGQGEGRKYFHMMLNIDDDDLDPYEYRLYGHIRRVIGEGRKYCDESISQLAKACRMSVGKAFAARRGLEARGLIRIENVWGPGNGATNSRITLPSENAPQINTTSAPIKALISVSTRGSSGQHKRRKTVIHLAAQIAERDGGWYCHYCHNPLLPYGVEQGEEPYWHLTLESTEPPMLAGDGCGRYTPEQIEEALHLVYTGQLRRWRVRWNCSPHRVCQVDHKVPVSRGGSDDLDNLVLACWQCNQAKHAQTAEDFFVVLNEGVSE